MSHSWILTFVLRATSSYKALVFISRDFLSEEDVAHAVKFSAMNLRLVQRNKYAVYPSPSPFLARSCGNIAVQIVCFTLLPEKMHVILVEPYFYDLILFSL